MIKFCKVQEIAVDAIAQYRNKPAKPLTVEELMQGKWWCKDVSKDCAIALRSKGLTVFNFCEWGLRGEWENCCSDDGFVRRSFFDSVGNKQIHRIGNEFYWS